MDLPNTLTPNVPNNLPANEPSDLSYQVMPQEDQHYEPSAGPVPPPSKMPMEEEVPIWRNKWVYIIGGAVVILILGGLIYFLSAKKSATPSPIVSTTKLPKVWLNQYFGSETCADQNTCGDIADPDSDGLENFDEFKAGTNPIMADTDGDGLADGDEVSIYKTNPIEKYTDTRTIVAQNNYTDGSQIKNGYDPLTPGLKFSDERKTQIATDTSTYSLHEPTITTLSTSPVTQVTTQNVTIQNSVFSPQSITVNKGDTVVWTNKDSMAHTVTGTTGGPVSPSIASQGTYSFTFPATGTFTYHCTIHPTMTGTVIVQ